MASTRPPAGYTVHTGIIEPNDVLQQTGHANEVSSWIQRLEPRVSRRLKTLFGDRRTHRLADAVCMAYFRRPWRVSMNGAELIEAWRATLAGLDKTWVLFENGTCIVFTEPASDLTAQAKAILREFGRAGDGSEIGDFAATISLPDGRGWLVAGHRSDIVTFVSRDEIAPGVPDAAIGRIGRAKREQDTEQLRVLHVGGKRQAAAKARAKRTSRPQISGFSFAHPGGDCVVWYAHRVNQILDIVIAPRAMFAACYQASSCRLRVGEAEVAFGTTHMAYIFEAGAWRIVPLDGLKGSDVPHVMELERCGSTSEIARKVLGKQQVQRRTICCT